MILLAEPPPARSSARSPRLRVVPPAPIRLVGDATPPDLVSRLETKFVFRGVDLGGLRCALTQHCKRVVHAGSVSRVCSVYFDDLHLSTCHDNLVGVGLRHKTRVRWYDSELPREQLFFETKWRRHRVTGKDRLELACERPLAELTLRELHRALRQALPPARQNYLARDTEAVNLVEYQREHYLFEGGRARITLDYGLRFFPLLGRRRLARRFGHRLPGVALIECKTAVDDAGCLDRVLASLRGRASGFSKYVTACQSLGYASHH